MTPEVRLNQAPAHLRHGANIGQPLTRRDGILKVTGKAPYAADRHPPDMLFAVLAVSSIARGRVTSLDIAAAKRHPGVVDVMTPAHKPRLALDPDANRSFHVSDGPLAERRRALCKSANRCRDCPHIGSGN
jgi:xanthine dehydrogenase YagR molybdenum-binding subunit